MKSLRNFLAITLLGTALALGAQDMAKTPAFPGAEGFGRYTTGGRGGKVYHVTNVKDSGSGSLRWALSQSGPRTIVFDVSGTIHLLSGLKIPANTTLAGQTAPGDGICLADYPVSIGSNSIIRYVRFRLGNKYVTENGADGWDGLNVMDSENIIIDHCSVSWSIDECCSLTGNKNTTLQWSIVSQSLVNSGHSKGAHGYGGNWGGSGASYHHNLVVHHGSRTPRLGPRPTTQLDERMDMRNNVIYNFGGNGCYGGEAMNVNIVNNYYKPGPGSPTGAKGRRIAGVGIRTVEYCLNKTATAANYKTATGNTISTSVITGHSDGNVNYLKISGVRYDIDAATNTIDVGGKKVEVGWNEFAPALHMWGTYFVEGNYNPTYADVTRDNWTYGMYNQIDTSNSATDCTWSDQVKSNLKLDNPIDFVYVTTHDAETAYERVCDYAGCSLSRDWHDDLMVSDTRKGVASHTGSGNTKGMINSQEDNRPWDAPDDWNAWPVLNSTEAPLDTDRDGMPDAWETANGLNPNDASDAILFNDEGYTMIEVYLASIVAHITEAQNAGGEAMGYEIYHDPVAESYEVSVATREGSAWTFGNGISVSNNSGGGYTTNGNYIGLGRDQQHTFTLPDNAEIKWLKIEGRGRYNTSSYTDAHLVELNGTIYEPGTYSLEKCSDNSKITTIEVPLATPAKRTMTMTWTGNNPFMCMTMYTTDHSGVDTVALDSDEWHGDDGWYNLQGVRFDAPTSPGLYIHRGKKIIMR